MYSRGIDGWIDLTGWLRAYKRTGARACVQGFCDLKGEAS